MKIIGLVYFYFMTYYFVVARRCILPVLVPTILDKIDWTLCRALHTYLTKF